RRHRWYSGWLTRTATTTQRRSLMPSKVARRRAHVTASSYRPREALTARYPRQPLPALPPCLGERVVKLLRCRLGQAREPWPEFPEDREQQPGSPVVFIDPSESRTPFAAPGLDRARHLPPEVLKRQVPVLATTRAKGRGLLCRALGDELEQLGRE